MFSRECACSNPIIIQNDMLLCLSVMRVPPAGVQLLGHVSFVSCQRLELLEEGVGQRRATSVSPVASGRYWVLDSVLGCPGIVEKL